MTASVATIYAPAKVNLFLRVLDRRPDGYHLLDSVLLPISLYDEVSIRSERRDSMSHLPPVTVVTDSAQAPGGPANLAHRAATLLLGGAKQSVTVQIDIRKRIPVGSGMGGGSSDAAAVLWSLNRLLGSPVSPEALLALAGKIGSDIPFFLIGQPARVAGTGDIVRPLSVPHSLSLVVCSDGVSLSTREVYARVDLSLTTRRPVTNIADFIGGLKPLSELLVNDLEAAATQIHPGVLSLKAALAECGALGTLMTGSGSAVFGIWPDPESAANAAKVLRDRGLWAQSVQTLDRSPVIGS